MTNLKLNFLTLIFIFIWLGGFSQTTKTIDSLESQQQACLDKGEFMLGCSERFYFQMDSLLNVLYKKLRTKCDSAQKVNLKNDEIKWLVVRDKQFKYNRQQVNKEAKEDGFDGGEIEKLSLIQRNANFVKDRVIELINKSPDNYSPNKYKSKSYKVSTE